LVTHTGYTFAVASCLDHTHTIWTPRSTVWVTYTVGSPHLWLDWTPYGWFPCPLTPPHTPVIPLIAGAVPLIARSVPLLLLGPIVVDCCCYPSGCERCWIWAGIVIYGCTFVPHTHTLYIHTHTFILPLHTPLALPHPTFLLPHTLYIWILGLLPSHLPYTVGYSTQLPHTYTTQFPLQLQLHTGVTSYPLPVAGFVAPRTPFPYLPLPLHGYTVGLLFSWFLYGCPGCRWLVGYALVTRVTFTLVVVAFVDWITPLDWVWFPPPLPFGLDSPVAPLVAPLPLPWRLDLPVTLRC